MKTKYITSKDLAQELKVNTRTIFRMIEAGMPCVYINANPQTRAARPRFELEKVMKWLEERSQQKGGEQ